MHPVILGSSPDQHIIYMGKLNDMNGPAGYAFPNELAAQRFASFHRKRDPFRNISVVPA
jgi:hypothetical protein